jgi:hypothetical protein
MHEVRLLVHKFVLLFMTDSISTILESAVRVELDAFYRYRCFCLVVGGPGVP